MKKARWWKETQREVAGKSEAKIENAKPKTLADLPALYTVKQVAEYFCVNVFTLYRWKSEGLIQSQKMNRQVRFTAEQIADCKAKREALAHG